MDIQKVHELAEKLWCRQLIVKMKTAILLFGDYRQFEKASISHEFFKYMDVDFFISTWDKTTSYDEHYDSNIEKITDYRINKFLLKNAVFHSIVDENLYANKSSTEKMIFHWKVLAKALRESTVEYDCVCLLRIDFYIKSFNYDELVLESQSNKLHVGYGGYVEEEDNLYNIADVSYSGKPEIVLDYIDRIPEAPIASHYDFGCIVNYSLIEVEVQKSIIGLLVRPLTAHLITSDHEYNTKSLEDNFENIVILSLIYNKWLHSYTYGTPTLLTLKEFISHIKVHIENFNLKEYEK